MTSPQPNELIRYIFLFRRAFAWALLRENSHKGTLVSSSYEREYGKGKKAKTVKHTVWQTRVDSIRKLNRGENEPDAIAPGSSHAAEPQSTVA